MEEVKQNDVPLEQMEDSVTVTPKMASFIDWCYSLGEDKVREMVRGKILELKEESKDKPKGKRNKDGFVWDAALEPNDGKDQWKNGGDCNLCRKIKYCGTKCRANRLLKQITTPFLYQIYLDENPDAAAAEVATSMKPEDVLKMVGIHE